MSVTTIQGDKPHHPISNTEALTDPKLTSIFSRSTQSLIDLLKWGGHAGLSCAFYTTLFALEVCRAVQTIFYRLIFSPPFNPLDPAFKEVTLANFEKKVPELQHQLILLELKFNNLTSYEQDLKDLEQISNEIHGTYSKLQLYHSILIRRPNFQVLEQEVKKILDLYGVLNCSFFFFMKANCFKILTLFNQQLDLLTQKGLDLPSSWKDEMIDRWNRLLAAFENYSHPRHDSINLELQKLSNKMEQLDEVENHPLRLRNEANSCYLASAFQAFACLDLFRNEVKKPIPIDPSKLKEYKRKSAVQNELLKFIDVQTYRKKASPFNFQYFLSIFDSLSISNLRRAIFKSKLQTTLMDKSQIYAQHDAVYCAEFFIDQFLPKNKFKLEFTKTSSEFSGLAFLKEDDENVLKVSVPELVGIDKSQRENESEAERNERIQREIIDKSHMIDLIHQEMEAHIDDPSNPSKFNPQKDKYIVTDPIEGEKSKLKPKCRVAKYHRSCKLIDPPEVLTIQFKLACEYDAKVNDYVKIERPIVLPQDGTVDLSLFTSGTTRYRIVSYVVHKGKSMAKGHYVSYVSRNGKYYFCDDLRSDYYQEISEREFLSCDKPYLVVLEKI